MSSLNNLFNRVQMLEEAKYPEYDKLKNNLGIRGKMKKAGLPASSRDTMLFITRALSRVNIITPEEHDHTVKGQHTDRMEKIMAILRNKEEEINAKSDELVEYINKNLDNYTAGAGTDRDRVEKYKEMAKNISQEVQNIKAGKETDDALRDIVKKADEDLLDSLQFGAEDTTTIIEINAGNVANVDKVRAAVEGMANELGVEVTGNTVEFSVDEGSQIDQMVKKNGVAATEAFFAKHFEGEYTVTVSIIPPAGAEEKEKVAATVDALSTKPEGIQGREHLAAVGPAAERFLKNRGLEPTEDGEGAADGATNEFPDGEGKYEVVGIGGMHGQSIMGGEKFNSLADACAHAGCDPSEITAEEWIDMEGDGTTLEFMVDEDTAIVMHKNVPASEDAEYQSPYDDTEAKLKDAADIAGIDLSAFLDGEGGLVDPREVHDLLKDTEGGSPVTDDDIDRLLGGGNSPITESKYTTADYLTDIYANVKPIVETIVEGTTINENGQTTHTQQYLVEKREEAIEQVYTNQYLTEQKASDSLLVPKEEKRQSFKERYQPKTSYQLEELRRYGL
jgi:hypothetical protein